MIRKVLRYIKLYGWSRTLAKIKLRLHIEASSGYEGDLMIINKHLDQTASIAVVGCGSFTFSHICFFLRKENRNCLRYAYDIEKSKAKSLCETYNGFAATNDFEKIIKDSRVKLVYIASNHSTHAKYAIDCLNNGQDVHVEKPHAITVEELKKLVLTAKKSATNNIFLGFNRPKSKLVRKLKKMLREESGPLSLSFFVVGHKLPQEHWYFLDKEGGRVLGNLCHWTDLTLHLIDKGHEVFPCRIKAVAGEDPDSNFVVSVNFNDGSLVSYTFSVKEYSFEGVREFIQVHKGELLVNISDFQRMEGWKMEKKFRTTLLRRDQGHRSNILHSYNNMGVPGAGEDLQYVYDTGYFMLQIKKALETREEILCTPKLIQEMK